KNKIKKDVEEDNNLLAKYKKTCDTAEDTALTTQLEKDLEVFRVARKKIMDLDFTKPTDGALANQLQEKNTKMYDAIIDDLNKLQDLNTKYAKSSWKETTELFHHSTL